MFQINPKIFKAYDIRGIYQEDFDDDFAYNLGLAFVELRQEDVDYKPGTLKIAVGADMRSSSPALKEKLIDGLISAGAEVIDLGLVATPTFYFSVGHKNYDGGIMISASHNPKEWNGFKLVRCQGIPISGETGIEVLKEKILKADLKPATKSGIVSIYNDALEDEMAYTLNFLNTAFIKSLKIVVDTANGMGATYIKDLFENLPINLIPLNFTLDGSFPAHEADPLKEENLEELKAAVLKEKADLGIATDGDGDRVFFIDNSGQTINPAIIRGLLAKEFLISKPGAKIGYDVRPGKITTDLIAEGGGKAILTRVGHSLIKEQMLKEDIYFAGESSGHFYLKGGAGCFEYPGIMILELLKIFSPFKNNISDYLKQFEKYISSGEINCNANNKEEIFKKIETKYQTGEISKLDGLSVAFPDFWFNVRASNTESKIRLNLEAIDRRTMEEKCREVLDLIK